MLKQCKLLERQEKMEVVVKTNPYANQESGKMGVANVTFGDVFKARSMNIIKGRDNELLVSMPS